MSTPQGPEDVEAVLEELAEAGAVVKVAPVDAANKFLVGAGGDGKVVIMRLPPALRLTSEEAANLAAYLVALGPGRARFLEVLDAVEGT